MKIFRRIQTADKDLMSVQNNVEQTLNPVVKLALLNGTMIKGVGLTGTAQKIGHNLTRQPIGWFLMDVDQPVDVYRVGWNTTTITLQSTGACTVSIWIF